MKTRSSHARVRRSARGRSSGALGLFQRCARDVPAYRAFLRAHRIDPSDIRSEADLASVPPTSKDTYIRAYPYEQLFWHGSLARPHILTATSGSTGEPAFFARTQELNAQAARIHEQFLLRTTLDPTKPTLIVVCFGMGIWIGGLITTESFEQLQREGYPLAIVTPGINKKEIARILSRIAPRYPQLVIAGYPPLLKDILDEAHASGIALPKRVALLTAAEAYTESFREYLGARAGVRSLVHDIMNIYGTADLGPNGFETPLSVLVRRLALKDDALFGSIFGAIGKIPTLAQYEPSYTHFDEVDGQLLMSGDSAMPLVRYAIGDNGGVRTFSAIEAACAAHGIDLRKEMRRAKVDDSTTTLPFVFVYERADLSTTLYGLQIFPQVVREILLHESFSPFVSGRISLETTADEAHQQKLVIHTELNPGKEAPRHLASLITGAVVAALREKNAEYRELATHIGARAEPEIRFWPHEDPHHFSREGKQRWVAKPSA